ncbi:MAG: D-sedoheptulose 7-phosphate isomerase [Gemmatimonadetes bacterium]|nr:D-sedoheptulose 7-phosphate isomerase [Gemmatimonadota bacterium]
MAQDHLRESARVKGLVASECGEAIVRAAELIATAFRSGGKLLLCGNGGSAADCQHLAAEFVSVLQKDRVRAALPAIALTTDTSFLTASANDFGFEHVFARQVEALGKAGDVLIGISTSGTSANIIAALRQAKKSGLRNIIFTGKSGGKMNDLGDVVIRVPSELTQHIQESHIAIGHVICELVERTVSGEW